MPATVPAFAPFSGLLSWLDTARPVRTAPAPRTYRPGPVLMGDLHMHGPTGRPLILDLCPPPPLDPARAGRSRRAPSRQSRP